MKDHSIKNRIKRLLKVITPSLIGRVGVGLLLLLPLAASAQITQKQMEQIYEAVKTPYKYGLVVAPTDNYHKYDCPTVFRHDGRWYMTYVCYDGKEGTDGRGYETWIATSPDLLHWTTLGRALAFPEGEAWDKNQRGGFPALIDYQWGGSYEIQSYKNQYWMTYIGGPGTGYEAVNAPLSIGLAHTGQLTAITPWQCQEKPILSYDEKEAQWWEQLTQYKSTIYRMPKKYFGYPYVMYYNAGGKDATHPKGERIGIALSKDLQHWKRYKGNPVFAHDTDGTITGDAQIVQMPASMFGRKSKAPVFVMFYFSAYNPTREYNAFNTFAVSRDLVHWQDWTGPDLIIPSKPYDEMFAHKSYVVNWNDTVYHFYCAVNNSGQRGIAVATNRFVGKSEVSFPVPEPTGHRQNISLNDDWEVTFDGKTFRRDVPFNLDDYYGALQKEHGNLHGICNVRKVFSLPAVVPGKQYFLRLEGVGTYADITLNGHHVGRFDIGRTVETVNVTRYIAEENELKMTISHPEKITDMPWVCGGCSSEWGFSEGSQAFGIFRPVTLEVTDEVRIEPFGVHVWNTDSFYVETEIKNYGRKPATIQLVNKLCDKSGKQVLRLTADAITLAPGELRTVRQISQVKDPQLWSLERPYLYDVNTIIKRDGKATESTHTDFGFRTISWPLGRKDGDKRFFLNGKPVLINGVCEYEHEFGQSHAFSNEQIEARVKMVRDLGFNAFRDAHQPHNLHYQELFDLEGILWWPQFSAHIWYDTRQFRSSFKRHLIQWVKERRNNPSNILWGLQNESTLPKDFAEECAQIIRDMDPTCGTQRLVTTCNGGEGTDWNVVQNWSGTYGGNIDNYANELKQPDQLLNGEYGAWRTLGNHTDKGYSEEAHTALLLKKVKLAESARDSVCGQFLWLLNSHDNPGRRQPDEALRRVDKVGPFNYKGLITPWDQPVDAYYAYQRHYHPASAPVPYVAVSQQQADAALAPTPGLNYLYRLNCGGDAYTDSHGNTWMQDNTQWSHSWAERFMKDGYKLLSPYQASQTVNDSLPSVFRTSRFGRHELSFRFPAAPGDYTVELYFTEPWYRMPDAEGFRIFDVAVNDSTVIHDLDIWAQSHYGHPYKRTVNIRNKGNEIKIHFPKVKAGQAIISAIAIGDPHPTSPRGGFGLSPSGESEGGRMGSLWESLNRDTLIVTPDSLLPPKSSPALQVEGTVSADSIVWDYQVGVAKVYALRFRYYNPEAPRRLHVKITDQNGVAYTDDDITFLQTQQKKSKRKMTSITTGTMTNAGRYHVVLTGEGLKDMIFDKLTIE